MLKSLSAYRKPFSCDLRSWFLVRRPVKDVARPKSPFSDGDFAEPGWWLWRPKSFFTALNLFVFSWKSVKVAVFSTGLPHAISREISFSRNFPWKFPCQNMGKYTWLFKGQNRQKSSYRWLKISSFFVIFNPFKMAKKPEKPSSWWSKISGFSGFWKPQKSPKNVNFRDLQTKNYRKLKSFRDELTPSKRRKTATSAVPPREARSTGPTAFKRSDPLNS